jgi:hypothetical protein
MALVKSDWKINEKPKILGSLPSPEKVFEKMTT